MQHYGAAFGSGPRDRIDRLPRIFYDIITLFNETFLGFMALILFALIT